MSCLPRHGRVDCIQCFQGQQVSFDETKREAEGWRITANPLAWGNPNAEVVVLGFSKGPTQAGALRTAPHDDIAYKGSRGNVGKILAHIGLIPRVPAAQYRSVVDRLISECHGRFHFSSFIRCTVERFDAKRGSWEGTGGGMLDKFVATGFGNGVAERCAKRFLVELPVQTKLVVMFGLGNKLNYVDSAMELYQRARGGAWRRASKVSYTDTRVTVVHVEHFASRGALIPDWLGETGSARGELGRLAKEAVYAALA